MTWERAQSKTCSKRSARRRDRFALSRRQLAECAGIGPNDAVHRSSTQQQHPLRHRAIRRNPQRHNPLPRRLTRILLARDSLHPPNDLERLLPYFACRGKFGDWTGDGAARWVGEVEEGREDGREGEEGLHVEVAE